MLPESTSDSSLTSWGLDSPVNDAVFKLAFPFTTIPSSGIFSPTITIITSLIATSVGSKSIVVPSSNTLWAISGLISIKLEIEVLDFPTA